MAKIQNAYTNGKISKDEFEKVALILTANNITITDYNKKGELILEEIKK